MSCAVEIGVWMLLPSIPVHVVVALYDLREFVLHFCACLLPCITERIVIGNAVKLSSVVRYELLPQYSHKHDRNS